MLVSRRPTLMGSVGLNSRTILTDYVGLAWLQLWYTYLVDRKLFRLVCGTIQILGHRSTRACSRFHRLTTDARRNFPKWLANFSLGL
jgi:hypothetical protein